MVTLFVHEAHIRIKSHTSVVYAVAPGSPSQPSVRGKHYLPLKVENDYVNNSSCKH